MLNINTILNNTGKVEKVDENFGSNNEQKNLVCLFIFRFFFFIFVLFFCFFVCCYFLLLLLSCFIFSISCVVVCC